MNRIILLIIFGLTFPLIQGKQVNVGNAERVAKQYFKSISKGGARGVDDLKLDYTAFSDKYTSSGKSIDASVCYYIFNSISHDGFIIVSGDDRVMPVLAYSLEGIFNRSDMPPNLKAWLESYKLQIESALIRPDKPDACTEKMWQNLLEGEYITEGNSVVAPLIQTKWNQGNFYNALCPYDYDSNTRTVTGCVATAMGQIMKYWNWPGSGTGSHSYTHPRYGILSANFGGTTYAWTSMPNTLTSSNISVATLLYHCGVSLEMDYNTPAEGGSAASTADVEDALENYFGYSSNIQVIQRSSYSESQWIQKLKAELDAGRPVQYAGSGSDGGHSFVCDGYDSNSYFHFNWGWGGSSNGYFIISELNPGNVSQTEGFNSNQRAVIGIAPQTVETFDLRLVKQLALSDASIEYFESFNVSTNIVNSGSNKFTGDYAVFALDNSNTIIDTVYVHKGFSLSPGNSYVNDLNFQTDGSFSMVPGNYKLEMYYRPTGKNWIRISDNGTNINLAQITVTNTNSIELASSISTSPAHTFTRGLAGSATMKIKNSGITSFNGYIRLALFKLDGYWAQTIELKTQAITITPGSTSPTITFNSSNISVMPGTYLLALQHRTLPTDSWSLSGGTVYPNPTKIVVSETPLNPDIYESNNTLSEAKDLPVSFMAGNCVILASANCHKGTDVDYYKIQLPSGHSYNISSRLHDSYRSDDGNNYTLDAQFSWSKDGQTWSSVIDDIMQDNIGLPSGGTVYYKVNQYFAGQTGTYKLDIRILITGIEQARSESPLLVYPNPANEIVYICPGDLSENQVNIAITNLNGVEIKTASFVNPGPVIEMNLSDLSSGIYIVSVRNGSGKKTNRLVVNR